MPPAAAVAHRVTSTAGAHTQNMAACTRISGSACGGDRTCVIRIARQANSRPVRGPHCAVGSPPRRLRDCILRGPFPGEKKQTLNHERLRRCSLVAATLRSSRGGKAEATYVQVSGGHRRRGRRGLGESVCLRAFLWAFASPHASVEPGEGGSTSSTKQRTGHGLQAARARSRLTAGCGCRRAC